MYRYYCLRWRFSLILNSLSISICLMFPGRSMYVVVDWLILGKWVLHNEQSIHFSSPEIGISALETD